MCYFVKAKSRKVRNHLVFGRRSVITLSIVHPIHEAYLQFPCIIQANFHNIGDIFPSVILATFSLHRLSTTCSYHVSSLRQSRFRFVCFDSSGVLSKGCFPHTNKHQLEHRHESIPLYAKSAINNLPLLKKGDRGYQVGTCQKVVPHVKQTWNSKEYNQRFRLSNDR